VAKETIIKKEEEIKDLKAQINGYVDKLIK
jgi:hypothetical protein